MRKILFAMLLFALAGVIISGCKSKTAEPPKEVEKKVKEKVFVESPDFALKNYDGKEYKLSDYKGKIIVLEWFNYECPFCRYHYETTTEMVDLAKKYKEQGVVWLAVNSTSHQETEKNKNFAEKFNVPFPILDDRDGKVGRMYGAVTTPHMFIINKDGVIVYNGAIDNSPMGKVADNSNKKVVHVAIALDELLAGKEVSVGMSKPYGCSVKYAN